MTSRIACCLSFCWSPADILSPAPYRLYWGFRLDMAPAGGARAQLWVLYKVVGTAIYSSYIARRATSRRSITSS